MISDNQGDFVIVKNKKNILFMILMFIASALLVPAVTADHSESSRQYMTHAPIVITSDVGFNAANGVTDGTGSEGDPYEIMGWEITAAGGSAISITSTTKYFQILNCYVKGATGTNAGILLTTISNGGIENTVLENNNIGIKITDSTNIDLGYNTLDGNAQGILSDQDTMLDIHYNGFRGYTTAITVNSASALTPQAVNIDYNTFVGGDTGVSINTGNQVNVDYNTFSNVKKGIKLNDVVDTNFDYNTFNDGTSAVEIISATTTNGDYNYIEGMSSFAIVTTGTTNTGFSFNNFIGNGGSGKQAKTSGSSLDDWDGNHWDDWTIPDANSDGVVDIPYDLVGGEVSDKQPLVDEIPGTGTGISPLSVTASGTPVSGDAPLTTIFKAVVSGGMAPYNYAWDLGDGGSGTSDTIEYLYDTPGTYNAKVVVTDFLSSSVTSSTITVTVTGSPPEPLAASATADKINGSYPLAVNFTGLATGGVSPYSYGWAFGDGDTGTGASINHIFTTSGTYSVTMTVTDAKSNTKSSAVITITVSNPIPELVIDASSSKITGSAPLKVEFTSSVTGGLAPFSYQWDFKDGGTSNDANPTYKFKKKGLYTVTLKVTDSAGNTKEDTTVVTVLPSKEEVSPGFEVPFLVIAVALAFILLRRNR